VLNRVFVRFDLHDLGKIMELLLFYQKVDQNLIVKRPKKKPKGKRDKEPRKNGDRGKAGG